MQAQSGDINQAIDLCYESLSLHPHAAPHHLLSQLHLARAEIKESLQHIEEAAKLDSSQHMQASLRFHRGLGEYANRNPAKAREWFKESFEMGPHDAQTLEKLAIATATLGDIPLTLDILKDLWHMEPFYMFHNSLPFVRVADLYDEQRQQAEAEGGTDSVRALNTTLSNITRVTQRVFMDISIEGKDKQRVVYGLYGHAAPKAVRNFVEMSACKDPKLCYKGTRFHRVVPDFLVQGGDVLFGTGLGIANIYGRPYSDDPYSLVLMHDQAGLLLAANAGLDSNGGQFVVVLTPAPHLNGNHMIMGRVLEGLEHVEAINKIKVDGEEKPEVAVTIVDCGVIREQ